jgi:hypothetical protein
MSIKTPHLPSETYSMLELHRTRIFKFKLFQDTAMQRTTRCISYQKHNPYTVAQDQFDEVSRV